MTSPTRTADPDPAPPRGAVRPALLALAIGAIAGLVTIAVSDLTAWILAPDAAPLSVLAAFGARLLPTTAADTQTSVADVIAHPLTLVVTGAMVVLLGALAGLLELRRRYAGGIVFALLAIAGLAATLVIVPSWLHTFLPALVGPIAGFVALHLLISRLIRHLTITAELSRRPVHGRVVGTGTDGAPAEPVDLTGPVTWQRRAFLRVTVIAGAVAAAAVAAGEILLSASRRAAADRARIQLPTPAQPAPPVPSGADLAVKGLTPYVTDNADFYRIDTALHVPVIDPETWQLKVTGLVEQEVTLTYAQLLARPLVAHLSTLTCKANPIGANPIAGNLVGNATWLGLPVRELLAEARPKAGADMVLSVSVDGWSAGTPLTSLQQDDKAGVVGGRHERAAVAARARVPGADDRPRTVRRRVGHQVGHRAQGDDVRRGPGLLDAARLVGRRGDQADLADRRAALHHPRAG